MAKRTLSIVCPRCAQLASITIVRRFDPARAAKREQVEFICASKCELGEDEVAELRAAGLI